MGYGPQSVPTVHLDDRYEYRLPHHVTTENTGPISNYVLISDVVRPEILGLQCFIGTDGWTRLTVAKGQNPNLQVCPFGCTASVGLRCPPNSHSHVIVLPSCFRFQVSTNHVVDAMASQLVANKPDSVKHLLVLINHSDQRCTWGLFALLADFAQVSYSHNES